jgi:hypothetical protein
LPKFLPRKKSEAQAFKKKVGSLEALFNFHFTTKKSNVFVHLPIPIPQLVLIGLMEAELNIKVDNILKFKRL